jgi:hypothetical protein
MVSAISAATRGSSPSYGFFALSVSPLNLTMLNSVSTIPNYAVNFTTKLSKPGFTDDTLNGVATNSLRSASVIDLSAAFVAQYTLPFA